MLSFEFCCVKKILPLHWSYLETVKSESDVLKTRKVKAFVRFLRMNEFTKVKDSSDKSSFCFKFIVLKKLYFKFIVLKNKTLVGQKKHCFFFWWPRFLP
jgi:hypothetical protein